MASYEPLGKPCFPSRFGRVVAGYHFSFLGGRVDTESAFACTLTYHLLQIRCMSNINVFGRPCKAVYMLYGHVELSKNPPCSFVEA